ncbi:SDR family NAD(P)-dependent oxidoreductase [Serratia fonticola]|uniref:SDR family oxidoreductase n=1 Tax=Serratia fonticola TaxID=47917 RepID=A0AAW3WYR5_SERFO|nr:SDR family oxidoreductase [Serratia fonticola]MBC3215889.1 SDR family oxidoreductase [Serratia fonticola]NYA16412.1 SDR family oxidoreductase [Serratia fonticola]NYA36551.1 SDR family oxidoreductase [Serratia fonticola]
MSDSNLFISGGASGIGRSVVIAALNKGWNVGFSYYRNQNGAQHLLEIAAAQFPQQSCRAYLLDVADSFAVDAVGDRVLADFSNIDAVVCNAGTDLPGNLVSMTDEDWAQVINTNLNGAFYLARYFLPLFMNNKYGRIVTLSSLAKDGSSGQAAYAASKAGLVGLTKTIAKEYGHLGITANVLVPGLIDTNIIGNDVKGITRFFEQYAPAKRLGTTAEVAEAILFLISAESSYVNGAIFNVTGGIDWVY